MAKNPKRICVECKREMHIPKSRQHCQHCRTRRTAVNNGTVLPPDYKDTTYAPYKEPMIKNDTGYGYVGAIVQSTNGSHIQCNECGYFYGNLAGHVLNYHKIAPRDYKIKYGLRVRDGLVSPMYKELARERFKDHPITERAAEYALLAKAALAKSRADGMKPYNLDTGGSWIPQLRNERGVCADQLLEKIKQLAADIGRTPNYNDFGRAYGWGAACSVQTLHGSWDKAIIKTGLLHWKAKRRQNVDAQKDKILTQIIEWYKTHHRTPRTVDFDTDDDLPSALLVQHYFKGLNIARKLAGVPILVQEKAGQPWVESFDYSIDIRAKKNVKKDADLKREQP